MSTLAARIRRARSEAALEAANERHFAPAIAPRDPDAVQRQPEHIRRAAVLVPANDRVARHGGNMNGRAETSTRTSTQNVWRTS